MRFIEIAVHVLMAWQRKGSFTENIAAYFGK